MPNFSQYRRNCKKLIVFIRRFNIEQHNIGDHNDTIMMMAFIDGLKGQDLMKSFCSNPI